MTWWTPASRERVEALLASAVGNLHAAHRNRFSRIQVPLRSIPIAAHPGETVYVVAEHEGWVIYYSDIEEGWGLERPDSNGGIPERDSSQFELSHLMWQLFGDPNLMR